MQGKPANTGDCVGSGGAAECFRRLAMAHLEGKEGAPHRQLRCAQAILYQHLDCLMKQEQTQGRRAVSTRSISSLVDLAIKNRRVYLEPAKRVGQSGWDAQLWPLDALRTRSGSSRG